MNSTWVDTFATCAVILTWPVYIRLFVRRTSSLPAAEQNRASIVGIILQAAAVILIWIPRALFTPLSPLDFPISVMAPAMAVLLAVGSVWFTSIALQVLGDQWSFVAGIKVEHRLVQTGPYSIIRHPLYVCFFALVLATGIVWTVPQLVPVAMGIFTVGMWIRIRTEEKLMKEVFGAEFDRYALRVPAVIPFSISGARGKVK